MKLFFLNTIYNYVQQGVRIIGVFKIVCVFYDEINIFQRVITLLLNIEITKFKNASVDIRQSFEIFHSFRILC